MAKVTEFIEEFKSPNSSNTSGSLDTLAQLATKGDLPLEFDCSTSMSDKANLLKRARRKYFTNRVLWKLIDAAKSNTNSTLHKSYWNTYHCSRNLFLNDNGTITGKYCNTRWCMVCNAIRTAKHINQYSPIVKQWENPYFVTLTGKTIDSNLLKDRIEVMQKIFVRIRKLHSKKSQRSQIDFDFKGIRKLECTHNYMTNKYHPHFHIICNCKSSADFLVSNWIRCCTDEGIEVNRAAQDARPANGKSLVELFKYMTKVVTNRGGDKKNKRIIDGIALDIIFNAMKGKRTVQPFGFKVSNKNGSKANGLPTIGLVLSVLTWSDEYADWLDKDGYMLTNYVPSDGFQKLLGDAKKMDMKPKDFTAKDYQNVIEDLSKYVTDSSVLVNVKTNEKTRGKLGNKTTSS
jgi:hypothetical protein